jgi:RimJ/RimL family protein N-acetyltransferase
VSPHEPRIVLRALDPGDAAALFAYRSDPEVARYQSWEPAAPDEVRAFIRGLSASPEYAPGTWHQLGITLPETGELIGDCGVHVLEHDPRQAEFGITVAPRWQGQGLAGEALEALLFIVFDTLQKHRLSCSVDPRNVRSVALMERTGFRREAHHRESLWLGGEWVDDLVFAMLRREWLSRGS